MSLTKKYEFYLFALLGLAFFYNSYRYPLQINSSLTSSTYGDTPLLLQAGKYVICALILTGMLIRFLNLRNFDRRRRWYLAVIMYLMILPVAYGLALSNVHLLEAGFFVAIPVVLLICSPGEINWNRAARLLHWVLLVYLVVNAFQLGMAIFFDRMPALGHAGTTSIRFGSVLDDPNSFAILLALFAGFAAIYYTGALRLLVLGLLALSLVLTQSLTAIGSICLATVLLYGPALRRLLRDQMLAITVAFVSTIALLWFFRDLVVDMAKQKYVSSIVGHLEAFTVFKKVSPLALVGLQPTGICGESGYVNFIVNMGVPYTLIFLVLGLVAVGEVRYLAAVSCERDEKAVLNGAQFFLTTVMIGLLNLPYEQTFPVNAVYYLCIGLAVAGVFRRSLSRPEIETVS